MLYKSNHPLRKVPWNTQALHSQCFSRGGWVLCVEFCSMIHIYVLVQPLGLVTGRQKSIFIWDKVIQFKMFQCLKRWDISCEMQICKCLNNISCLQLYKVGFLSVAGKALGWIWMSLHQYLSVYPRCSQNPWNARNVWQVRWNSCKTISTFEICKSGIVKEAFSRIICINRPTPQYFTLMPLFYLFIFFVFTAVMYADISGKSMPGNVSYIKIHKWKRESSS